MLCIDLLGIGGIILHTGVHGVQYIIMIIGGIMGIIIEIATIEEQLQSGILEIIIITLQEGIGQ